MRIWGRRWYEIELMQGNCIEILRNMERECVDCVVTDPPYLMNHSTGGATNIGMRNKWQGNIKAGNTVMDFDSSIKFDEWLPEIYRVLKRGTHCYIFVNDKNLQELLNAGKDAGFSLSNVLVWEKNNCTPNRYYMKNAEFIIMFYKKPARVINNMSSKTRISCNNINGKNKKHPTEKPVELLDILIRNSTSPNEVVLDPFMGAGSTGVASVNAGRDFVGIELKEKYYMIAKEQIEKARAVRQNSTKHST